LDNARNYIRERKVYPAFSDGIHRRAMESRGIGAIGSFPDGMRGL
jgi:hypothetical protein